MTLSEVSTLLPPPEGMEWRHYDPDGLIAAEDGKTVIVDPEDDNRIRVSAWNGDDNAHLYTIPTDLPAAYLRALRAVGLAPDAEKEDMRRRLTWTSEVPTTPGRYLVEDPDADGAILMYEFGVGGLGWVEYVPHTVRFGPLGFASDSRFLLLANLKET